MQQNNQDTQDTPSNLPMVNIDLDGVLGDFFNRYMDVTGKFFHRISTPGERWGLLRGKEVGFYEGIKPYSYAASFVNEILSLDNIAGVRILTALPSIIPFPTAYNEKMRWVRKHIHPYIPVTICDRSQDKYLYCSKGDILIDDSRLNVSDWIRKGRGEAIFFTDPIDTMNRLKEMTTA